MSEGGGSSRLERGLMIWKGHSLSNWPTSQKGWRSPGCLEGRSALLGEEAISWTVIGNRPQPNIVSVEDDEGTSWLIVDAIPNRWSQESSGQRRTKQRVTTGRPYHHSAYERVGQLAGGRRTLAGGRRTLAGGRRTLAGQQN